MDILTRKCSDCGYLSQRVTQGMVSQGLIEVEEDARETGDFPTRSMSGSFTREAQRSLPNANPAPICFARAFRLDKEYEAAWAKWREEGEPRLGSSGSITLKVIERDRKCQNWVHWEPGFSPKEHREMLDQQRLVEFQAKREDDWQRFQTQLSEDDRKWREEQETKAEERHQREMETIRTINKTQMWVMGGLVTLIIVLVTLLGGAMEASWIPKWFGIGL